MKKIFLITILSLTSFMFMPINQSYSGENNNELEKPKKDGANTSDDNDFRTMLNDAKINKSTDEIYKILNPEIVNEESIKARNDLLYPKRNDQIIRDITDTNKKTFNKNWVALDWEAKRSFMRIKAGGVDAVTESLINFTIDLAIKQAAVIISKVDDGIADKFETIAQDIKKDTAGISRMVRLENADETRQEWYDAMFIDNHSVTINTIGQQLIDSVKRVGIKMVKNGIGGDEGKLAAKLLTDASF